MYFTCVLNLLFNVILQKIEVEYLKIGEKKVALGNRIEVRKEGKNRASMKVETQCKVAEIVQIISVITINVARLNSHHKGTSRLNETSKIRYFHATRQSGIIPFLLS